MLSSFFRLILGDQNQKTIDGFAHIVRAINELEPQIQALSDDALRAKTQEFRDELASGATLDDILPQSFAVVREASRRVRGERHFDVQIMGNTSHRL